MCCPGCRPHSPQSCKGKSWGGGHTATFSHIPSTWAFGHQDLFFTSNTPPNVLPIQQWASASFPRPVPALPPQLQRCLSQHSGKITTSCFSLTVPQLPPDVSWQPRAGIVLLLFCVKLLTACTAQCCPRLSSEAPAASTRLCSNVGSSELHSWDPQWNRNMLRNDSCTQTAARGTG